MTFIFIFLSKGLEHLEHLRGVRGQPGVPQDLGKEFPPLEVLARTHLSQSLQYPYNSLVRQLRLSFHLFSTATYMAMSVMPFSPDGISFKPLGEQEKVVVFNLKKKKNNIIVWYHPGFIFRVLFGHCWCGSVYCRQLTMSLQSNRIQQITSRQK